MLVVSTSEFRQNQKSYLNKIDDGIEVLLQRGKDKCYRISPVKEDDCLMSKAQFFEKIDNALEEIKTGKGKTVRTKKELLTYLDSL